jgi:hypothetical protein
MNLCTACNEDFSSVSAFDRHRTGTYAHPYSDEHPEGRRCLTPDELLTKGFHLDTRRRLRLDQRGNAPWEQ